jgi:dolichol kinase
MAQKDLLSDSEKAGEVKEISYNEEAVRKAVHAFSIIIPLFYFFVPRTITLLTLLPGCIAAITFDLARMTSHPIWTKFGVKLFGSMIRPKEKEGFTGASYILTTDFLVILMFDKPVALCAIAFIALGDSAAAMVGRRWGRHKYGNKSFEGSFGFFIAASAPAILFHLIFPGQLPLLVGISGALVATVVEGMTNRSDDNMTVPILSGLFMQVLLAFI